MPRTSEWSKIGSGTWMIESKLQEWIKDEEKWM